LVRFEGGIKWCLDSLGWWVCWGCWGKKGNYS
jgi:hypothetical protein